jgi:phage I-like protein
MHRTILVVCNNQEVAAQMMALNFDLFQGEPQEAAAALPVRLMLVPAGDRVTGRDGRSWLKPDPQTILDFFAANNLDIPMDIEHATQLKAPKGDAAPAQAWGKSLEIAADGSIWGAFEWTHEGSELVSGKSYRYYSPAYVVDSATGTIVGIKSVGLTNTPNLHVPALNQQQEKGATMNLVALLAALGLAPTATFDEALNSITKMKGDLTVALNSAASPSLDKFVPKADYELVLNRATAAEDKLTAQDKATLETAINTEIDAALKAGKINPSTKEYHVAQCHQEGGLDRFKQFVTAAPIIAGDSNLDKKQPGETDTALNAEEQKVCDMLGLSVEDYRKANPA